MKFKKAVITKFGGPENIKIKEAEVPDPKPSEALVRVLCSTVGPTDTVIRKGIYPLIRENPPLTLGYDFVGIVEKVGSAVTEVKVGDRVVDLVQLGGNAEYYCGDAKSLIVVKESIESENLAPLVLSYMTAYQILVHEGKLKTGQKVLVQGASGAVGTALVQIAKHLGAEVVGTASAKRRSYLESLGATAIDYDSPQFFSELKHLAGEGFDLVTDPTNHKNFNRSFKLLGPSGKLITYAVMSIAQKIEKKTVIDFLKFGLSFSFMMLKLKIWSSIFGHRSAQFFGIVDSKKLKPQRFEEDLNKLIAIVNEGAISPKIFKKISLEDVWTAHRDYDLKMPVGQVVIEISR